MSYDLTIVRADGSSIPRPEIDRVVASDPELEWSESEFLDSRTDTEETQRSPAIAWRGEGCVFWIDEELIAFGPDENQVVKLIEIAEALGARVVGDDGEVYGLDSSAPGLPRIAIFEQTPD